MTYPIELYPSKKKMVLLVLGSIIFVIGGIFIRTSDPLVGWSGIVFFGLGALVGVISLHPKAASLEIHENGFAFTNLFRKHFVPWMEVAQFSPIRIRSNSTVGWNFVPGYPKRTALHSFNKALSGTEVALPDTYGISALDLANLMNIELAKHKIDA